MANSIAALHNSRIEIESQEGVGTTVVLTIPANRVVVETTTTGNAQNSIAA